MESSPHDIEYLRPAAMLYRRRLGSLEAARKDLHARILSAASAGVKQATIAQITGFTEAHISNLVKKSKEGS